MRSGRRFAAVLLAAIAVAGANGCSDGGGDDDEGSAASTTTSMPGGRLRMGVARLASLDPALVSPDSPSASIAADLLFDGLTRLPPGEAAAEPALASSWSSADGVTWQFTIDPAAVFSDGSPVTAADAELSLERVVSQGQASLTASRLDAVAGFVEFLAAGGRGAGADLAGIVALDPATLQITLQRPMAWLPELLGAPVYGVVSAAGLAADGEAFATAPSVTSGPFALASTDGAALRLDRAGGRDEVRLDGVDLVQFDDLADAFAEFNDGELDWSLVAPGQVEVAADDVGADGFVPFQAVFFYGFNLADPMFADLRFRQAIVQAVDREAIVNAVYLGLADPLAGVVPPGVAGADPARCGAGCAHDPAAVAALLAAAFPSGGVPEVPIDFPDGPDETAVATIIEQQLEAAGIPAVLRPHPAADYGSFAVSGQQGFASLGWIGVQATPEDYLDRLFRTGSADNLTGFGHPAVDGALDQAATTLDPAERFALLAQAEVAVLAQTPILPIAQFRILSVQSDAVDGLDLSVIGTFAAEAVSLSG